MNNKSSTEYLDALVLDGKGLIIRDVMDSFKGYCGLFSFILSIAQMEHLDDRGKARLINKIIEASMSFMIKKYKANLDTYRTLLEERPQPGRRFNDSVIVPLKLQEDYELGIEEAKQLLYIEIEDIFRILDIRFDIE